MNYVITIQKNYLRFFLVCEHIFSTFSDNHNATESIKKVSWTYNSLESILLRV